jgi:hypothetical protein
MDDQPLACQNSESSSGKKDRRRIAIAAALLLMGAVVIDPGLLDDVHVSVQIDGNSGDESLDEFAQIEFMLAQSEKQSSTESKTSKATSHSIAGKQEQPAPPALASSTSLMIPTQVITTEDVPVPREAAIPVTAVSSPKEVVETFEVFIPSPDVAVVQTKPASTSYTSHDTSNTIRLIGTIDPIR